MVCTTENLESSPQLQIDTAKIKKIKIESKTKWENLTDNGRGWLCVIAAFVLNVIIDGSNFTFGVLFVALIEYFGESRSKTAWIGSLFAAVPLLCGPLASIVTSRLGYRKSTIFGGVLTLAGFTLSNFVTSINQLYLTYGMLAGIGISLSYMTSVVVVADYFEKKRALAMGLAECGAGFGTLIFAPMMERLIEEYGWRGAVLIEGGIASNIIVCGAMFRTVLSKTIEIEIKPNTKNETIEYSDPKEKVQNKNTRVNSRPMFDPVLVLFTITNFVVYFWYDVPYIFTVDRATSIGISSRKASYIVACMGVSYLAGNLVYGFLGDRPELDRSVIYSFGLILCGSSLIFLPFSTNYYVNLALAGFFGLLSAASESLGSVILADIVGVHKLTKVFGIVMFIRGIANLVGHPFAGWLFDKTGNYDATFWAAGVCINAATILFLMVKTRKKCRKIFM